MPVEWSPQPARPARRSDAMTASLLRLLPLLLCLAAAFPATAAEAPIRTLILTGSSDLPYHDWRQTTPLLRRVLEQTGRFEVRVEEEPAGLSAATLEGYDLLFINYNGPRWGRETEKAIEEFVRSGKGLFAFHLAAYGTFFGMEFRGGRWRPAQDASAGWAAWKEMLGLYWKPENIGHSVRHVFPVKWADPKHPIARDFPGGFLANDELYHRIDLAPGAHVVAQAYSDPARRGTGKNEPMLWVVRYGAGRAAYSPLGHDVSALWQPGVLAMFARAAEWAATGKVTLPARLDPVPKKAADAVRVLAVTGGHAYPVEFYTLFEGYPDIVWNHAVSPEQAFREGMEKRWDVVVLHDMHNTLAEPQRTHLKRFVESGGGVVSIHHAIVDYTDWPWWYEQVIGGKYFVKPAPGHEASHYKEGVEIVAYPAEGMARHPVLRGVGPLVLEDEAYRGMWHSPEITVLMETDHPLNDRPVVYVGPYQKARVVYIQFGHSASTMRHPAYRRLVYNAILWTAGRLE
ncbi:MAG TPA: ThuA domain-containing protein [Thermopetrobacter sp.]|nr:ThuA domain-containing protein [Thermopetrobacter sp.]